MRQPLRPDATGEVPATVELRIPATAEWVGVARLAAAGIASRLHLSIEEIEDLKLAVAEACTSCIQSPGNGDVHISCRLSDDRIIIAISREGDGRPKPNPKPGDDAELGGLGVFLIRALMDDVVYESDPDTGTKLVLTKLLGQ